MPINHFLDIITCFIFSLNLHFSVIRCLEIKNHTERTDKFRLCLFEHGIQKRIGEKVIAASVVNKKENIDRVNTFMHCSNLTRLKS